MADLNGEQFLERVKPVDLPDYMIPAWLGCLSWAISDPGIVAEFRKQTGNQWQPPVNGLEAMIDEATGVGETFIETFIQWVNANIWGSVGDIPTDVPDGWSR